MGLLSGSGTGLGSLTLVKPSGNLVLWAYLAAKTSTFPQTQTSTQIVPTSVLRPSYRSSPSTLECRINVTRPLRPYLKPKIIPLICFNGTRDRAGSHKSTIIVKHSHALLPTASICDHQSPTLKLVHSI